MDTISRLSWWHVIFFLIVIALVIYLAKRAHSKVVSSFVCLILICVSGLRHGYIDTRAYRNWFTSLNRAEVLRIEYLFDGSEKDRGFSFLLGIIKLFTDNAQVCLFVLAFITVGFLFWGIVNHVPQIDLGVFLFIATGCYLDTMNGVRQALVAAVLFYYLPKFLEENKIAKYMVLVLLMSSIHGSAMLFIPLWFLVTKKAWSNYTWGIICGSLIFYVFYNTGIGTSLVEILEGTSYGDDYGKMLLNGSTSVNVVRVMIAAVPIVMSYFTRKYKEKEFPFYNIVFNMSLINLMTWIFATKVLYFYRLGMYFIPYMIILQCYEIEFFRRRENRKLIKSIAIVCYFLYFIYQLYVMGDQFFVGYLKY